MASSGMISRWQWLLRQLTRRLWFRATLFSVLGVVTALVAIVVKPYISDDISTRIGADAVDNMLSIIASSMLAVTTFSLTTMVSAYAAATSNVTPRATILLLQDSTTQNVLATFIGSFLYSLVGIIALSTGAYGSGGRVVLFVVSIGVVVLVVTTLLRWIDHLARLGRVSETSQRIEDAAAQALAERARLPYLGGAPPAAVMPVVATPVFASMVGYVQHVDMAELARCAERAGGAIHVESQPGCFVDRSRPLARVGGAVDDALLEAVCGAFTLANGRSFEQDPRFGVEVLVEIASRALSPAVNDPGTAIDVIGRLVRLLTLWAQTAAAEENILYPAVHVAPLRTADLFDDAFTPLARDCAALVEVQIRLQKALRALARLDGADFRGQALRHARLALMRAEAGLTLDHDRQQLRRLLAETEAEYATSVPGGLDGTP